MKAVTISSMLFIPVASMIVSKASWIIFAFRTYWSNKRFFSIFLLTAEFSRIVRISIGLANSCFDP